MLRYTFKYYFALLLLSAACLLPNATTTFASTKGGSTVYLPQEESEEASTFSSHSLPANSAFNDIYYKHQWWITNMNLLAAFEQQSLFSSRPIIVAVIDTGIDYTHEDLKEHMWVNKKEIPNNNRDDDRDGYVDDYYGWDFYNNDDSVYSYSYVNHTSQKKVNLEDSDNHGTQVAGIIAATANNQKGIVGVASNVNIQIMTLKTFGGAFGEGNTKQIIKAIKYAEAHGAKIVNASWNFSDADDELKTTIAESNMLFVCAAGNEGDNIDRVKSYPCCYTSSNVIGVTSINKNNNYSRSFASYGARSVDLGAPGENILSTTIGNSYKSSNGTSMSTPMVSGMAAMIYAMNPYYLAKDVKHVILHTVTPCSSLKNKTTSGGKLNAGKAISFACRYVETNDTTRPVIKGKIKRTTKKVSVTLSTYDRGGSGLRLIRYASGNKSIAYFKKGSRGKRLSKKTLTYKKNTTITVYAIDHGGNQSRKVIRLTKKKSR